MKGFLALTALLVLTLPGLARADDWDQVVVAAKKEGVVNLYSASVGQPQDGLIAKAFEAKYGLPVHLLEVRASELAERINTEQAGGHYLGDVLWNGTASAKQNEAAGRLQPYGSLPMQGKLQAPFKPSATIVPILIDRYTILVNSDLVPAAQAPKSWADLTDPKWKGKILSDDMAAAGGGGSLFQVTLHALGRSFHENLARNQLVFSRQQRDSEQRVARGEYAIYIPFNMADMPILKGLPLQPAIPAEGAMYVTFNVAMLKNAPHPNAARLLMNFYLDDFVRKIIINTGKGVTYPGDDQGIDPAMLPLTSGKLLGTADDAAQQAEDLKTAATIYH